MAKRRASKAKSASNSRVSAKISHLMHSGEAKSQAQAQAMALSMERRGELGPRGGKKAKKGHGGHKKAN